MSTVSQRLAAVRARITQAEKRAGRSPGSVQLLAVSKTQPAAVLREAYAAGQRHFGESYLQEALPKMQALADLAITWHFIGPIQSNKTRDIARHFDWVHSVDREKIARRLNEQRPADLEPLNICLQVNISDEPNKSGIAPADITSLAASCATLSRLRLRGLMAIPAPEPDPDRQRRPFRQLHELQVKLNQQGFRLDTLSIGMSDDLEAAILEGATLVRIGTAVFGERVTT